MEVVRRVVAVHIDDARPFLERCLGIDTARVGAGLAVDFGAFVVFIYELRFVARHGLRSFRIDVAIQRIALRVLVIDVSGIYFRRQTLLIVFFDRL